jgi:hypothetical protein
MPLFLGAFLSKSELIRVSKLIIYLKKGLIMTKRSLEKDQLILDNLDLFYYKDGELYNKITRNNRSIKDKIAGTLCKNGYKQVTINNKSFMVHRIIFALHYKYLPEEIDHIDRNRLNNNIENLRAADRSINNKNIDYFYKKGKPIYQTNQQSGYRGVYVDNRFINSKKRFRAYILATENNGIKVNLGRFETIENAIIARENWLKSV